MDELSLYKLNQKLIELFNAIEMSDGEVSEEQESALTELNELIVSKVDGCIGFIDLLNDKIEIFKKREEEIKSARKVLENRLDNFKGYLEACLIASGKDKISGEFGYISKKKKPMVIKIVDENKIPIEFIESKTTVSIKANEIKEVLKTGQAVEGALLVESDKPSLNIKKGL